MADGTPFSVIAQLFSNIQHSKKGTKQLHLIDFMRTWRNKHPSDPTSFYPVMRLLCPNIEKDRSKYGLRESSLAKIFIKALNVDANASEDAKRLLKWKSSTSGSGEFSNILISILQKRWTAKEKPIHLTIGQVNEKLDELASIWVQDQATAAGSSKSKTSTISEQRGKIILFFYQNCSLEELRWLVRIILRDLGYGISVKFVLNCYHRQAYTSYSNRSDLSWVSEEFYDPKKRVEEPGISLFNPFQPMLADKIAFEHIERKFDAVKQPFWIEKKYDGERIIMHKRSNEYKWFSRNNVDYTNTYGADPTTGSLSPFIHDLFHKNIESCILDGEMMVMDMDTLTYEPFGALKTANNEATAKGADSRRRPVFFVFDMVFFNGHRMVDLPLRERYQHLTAAVSTKQGVLEITQHVEASTADDVLKALDQCILRREEGILSKQGEGESQNRFFCLTNQSLLVKHPLSSYLVASREHYWCKLKPENLPGISETFDVVVVGGQYGSGRRGGKLSHFIVAVLDDSPDAADKPPRFITAGRVGGGYEDRLLDTMLAKMEPYWKDYDRSNPPSWFIHAPKGEQPDKVIHPENSVIMEIMCSEIVPSDHFAVGHTYRFPRCKSVREDKSWRDIEPLTKFREMSLGGILLKSSASAHYANLNNNSQSANTGFKRRKVFNSSSIAKRIPTVGADNLGADVRGVQVTSRILEGIEFCVFDFIQPVAVDYNDRDQHQQAPLAKTKHEMERIIKAYGGTFVQNPVPERTTYVIADRKALTVKNLIEGGKFDIIKSSWLLECVRKQYRVALLQRHIIFATPKTQNMISRSCDKYGDSFYEGLEISEFKELCSEMDVSSQINKLINSNQGEYYQYKAKRMMMEIEGRYFQDDDSCGGGNIFRPFMAYFDLYDEIRVSPMFWGRNHQQRHELIMPNDIQGPMRLASLQDAELPELSTVPWKNKGLELLKQEFIIRGGSVVNVWCPGVTHVILLKTRMREEDKCVNNNNNNSNPFLASARSSSFSIKKPKRDRIDDFLEALIKIPDHHILKPLFVGGEWVEESVRKGRAVAEVGFEAQVGI